MSVRLLGAFAIMLLFGLTGLYPAAQRNLLSRAYTHPLTGAIIRAHPRAAVWQAYQQMQQGQAQAALQTLQQQAPGSEALALPLVAQANYELGNYTAALAAWQQTGDAKFLIELGRQAQQRDDLELAEIALTAAWRVSPLQGADPLVNFLLDSAGDPQAAIVIYEQSLAQAGRSRTAPYWWFRLADIYAETQAWPQAVQAHQNGLASVSLMPVGARRLPLRYADLARAYYYSGDHAAAFAALDQALLLLPDEPRHRAEVYLTAGELYEADNQPQAALAAYQQLLKLEPNNSSAKRAIQRLSEAP